VSGFIRPLHSTLWRALSEVLITRFVGVAQIEEMTKMLFRVLESEEVERLLQEQVDDASNDQHLFKIAIAATVNRREAWLDRVIQTDESSGVVWRKQRAQKLYGFKSGNPLLNVWPEGPETDLRTSRRNEAAQWRHKEACAHYWWNSYWTSECNEAAFAAWTLFMESADRRAYSWMRMKTGEFDEFAPKNSTSLGTCQLQPKPFEVCNQKSREPDG
jgi:hypothetical protein